ncbi:methyltransferase domain-containing protein [Oleidesulfovibrio sp.]|uniref:methyltransferase domain-containing protein n=1 Tax=Oleidesulfovibrio sp. TaxID=2909707 RepID=UPI003A89B0C2
MEHRNDAAVISLETCPGCGKSAFTPLYTIPWERHVSVVCCENCALVFQTTPLSTAELEKYYRTNSTFHLHGPGTRHESLITARHAFLKDVLTLIPQTTSKRSVLDVGCGFGDFLASFDEQNWNRTGIELNAERASFARSELNLHVFERPLESPDIAPESINLLCAFGVIEHMYDIRTVLSSMHNCLAPGGLGMLSVADLASPERGISDYFCVEHILNFCTETLESVVRAAGFTVIKTGPLTPPDYKDICCIFRKENTEFNWYGMEPAPVLAQQLVHDVLSYIPKRQQYIETIRQRLDSAGIFAEDLKLGIYGAGAHTRQLLEGVPELQNTSVFFDSDPAKRGRKFENGTINSLDDISTMQLDAVLISSKAFENEILQMLTQRLPQAIRIIPLYRDFGDAS